MKITIKVHFRCSHFLLSFQNVEEREGEVVVRASAGALKEGKRVKRLTKRQAGAQTSTIVVVGGGAAGQVRRRRHNIVMNLFLLLSLA